MPAAYLTTTQANARLALYSITTALTAKELERASDALDLEGDFVGYPYADDQLRAFPRDVEIRDDVAGVVPDAILDWVALTAYQLHKADEPPVKSERLGKLGQTYTRGKKSRIYRLKRNLLRLYRGSTSYEIVSAWR